MFQYNHVLHIIWNILILKQLSLCIQNSEFTVCLVFYMATPALVPNETSYHTHTFYSPHSLYLVWVSGLQKLKECIRNDILPVSSLILKETWKFLSLCLDVKPSFKKSSYPGNTTWKSV